MHPALIGADFGKNLRVRHRQNFGLNPKALGQVSNDSCRRPALVFQMCPNHVRCDVPVAQFKPCFLAKFRQRVQSLKGVASNSPSLDGIDDTGEGIEHDVDVRADRQAMQFDIVGRIADDGDIFRIKTPDKSLNKLRRACPAGQKG